MKEAEPQSSDFKAQIERLEAVRDLLGEEQFQMARAKLEAALHKQQKERSLSKPASNDKDNSLTILLQSRQVSVTSDAHGNVIITGDNNLVFTLPPNQAPEPLLRLYYRFLAIECSRLPLGLIHEEFARPVVETSLTLQSVYTDLDVVSPPASEKEGEPGDRRWLGLRMERGEGGGRVGLLEAISLPEARKLALLGSPGSGKTTFVNYLTARLASGEVEGLPDSLKNLLPVRLILRHMPAYLPVQARQGTPEMLWKALEADIARYISPHGAEILLPYLQNRLAQSGGLILLDGLDEVPDAGRRRECLLQAVQAWVQALPKCRFLLTARPYAYALPKWQLPEFDQLVLAEFNQRQAQNFIRQWYAAVRHSLNWREEEAQKRAGELARAIQDKDYLADMASRPLLLTLMATLHSHKSRMPENRSDLYEFSVGLLLTRWQENRQEKDELGKPYLDEGMEKVFGLGEERLRPALEELALLTQRKQRESASGREEAAQGIPADIPLGDVLVVFSKYATMDVNPGLLVRYLENRTGLLVGRGEEIYTFPHRSFQEYLAACRLGNKGDDDRDFAQRLCDLVQEDLNWWREVFLLGVGKTRMGGYQGAVDVLNRLAPCNPQEVEAICDDHWRAAVLASEAALDLRLVDNVAGNDYYQVILKRLRLWLTALLEGAHLLPRERLQAGDFLGRLGDLRKGVGGRVIAREERRFHLPEIDWVHIPAGPFLMGSQAEDEQAYSDEKPQHTLSLPEYWIGRYPLTNAQMRPFVESDGYENPDYWTPEGWAWRQGAEPDFSFIETVQDEDFVKNYKAWVSSRQERGRPHWWEDPRWGAANRPVVGATWYEALAYCKWLESRLREAGSAALLEPKIQQALASGAGIRLPSEAEWEKAARGRKGLRWPWGNTWQDGKANTAEAGLKETSPVGIFSAGASPYGLQDMSGNVWEWTLSKWGMNASKPDFPYPYIADDGREDWDGPAARVVRGGSWDINERLARCAYRLRNIPALFNHDLGFRVVLSLARSES